MEAITLSNIEEITELNLTIYEEIISSTVKKLIDNKQTITAAESLTAGMFLSTIASVSGASAILEGGFITYANSAKINLLNIDENIINDYGVVSEQVAIAMATHSKKMMNSDIGVGLTGVAGPDSLENRPVGTVYIGLSINEQNKAYKFIFFGDRQLIRRKAVIAAMMLIQEKI
ncbi:hypothetical protein RD055328_09900 [Companilactobacillus sp. RD055328]|uniref:CinA family protein n=1 Tax=Companilactobacillus sp. RD055328 TaxID=2916634 RepID=UPI001FC8C63F|nr:nicotinamide-nucleotide amidohydrolase family protein [Companilactobacillus sp. RD055328]GKQ43067.1 hypothetical protein RD055328_09900 [Companilactobacillus sp. RD055328]